MDHDGGQDDATEERQSVFVVPGSDAAPLLETQVTTFNGVAFGVDLVVEPGWSATLGSLGLAPVFLVLSLRDRVCDPSAAQLLSGRWVRIGLVRQQPEMRPASQRVLLPMQVQQRLQLWVVTGLTRGQNHRDRAGSVVGQGVDF